jgi:hypothetical protein
MDPLEQYRILIKSLLAEQAAIKPAEAEVEPQLVFDDEHNSYQLMYIGWNGSWRLHGAVVHIRLRNGKIWIEEDGTEEGFASHLLEAGIPKSAIVLAFHAPAKRQYTDFAVA